LPELSARLSGSADLFDRFGRRPSASINLVTSHDGFTLEDVVSYDGKHNEANLEDNRDGHNENYSANNGAEGPSTDPAILARRDRQKRNMLATLMLSQGTPMLLAGDEMGRTQNGNNNAYCQDNPTSWVNWNLSDEARLLIRFVRRLARLRAAHPALRRSRFLHGRDSSERGLKDIVWLSPAGIDKRAEEWGDPEGRCIGMLLDGRAGTYLDAAGRPVQDAAVLLLLNAQEATCQFVLPAIPGTSGWQCALDTARPGVDATPDPGAPFELLGRSLALMIAVEPSEA
jgi:glycogen operon protein